MFSIIQVTQLSFSTVFVLLSVQYFPMFQLQHFVTVVYYLINECGGCKYYFSCQLCMKFCFQQ
jgi:hypothetical protein